MKFIYNKNKQMYLYLHQLGGANCAYCGKSDTKSMCGKCIEIDTIYFL